MTNQSEALVLDTSSGYNKDAWPERMGRHCAMDPYSVVYGERVELESYVEIQPNCDLLDDVVVRSYCRIGHHSSIGAGCVLKCGVIMGPYTRLDAEVFVGPRTLFLSDLYSEITNIRVKSGAFIGAGCMIMAEVTIGENAFIAAGTRVDHNVEPGSAYAGNPMRKLSKTGPEMKRKVFGA